MSSGAPLNFLQAAGERADAIVPLTWFTLIVSVVVCIVIAVILWQGVRRAVANGGAAETRSVAVSADQRGVNWIKIGLLLSAVPLAITLVWTMVTLAATVEPAEQPNLVLDVTGHQWWWEVHYNATQPDETFTTANEIHIPVGVRVLVRLHGADVIHSFWVPKLTGKTDTIPGQVNVSWMQASAPGVYLGQCTEYCGWQHAHMKLQVVAQSPEEFAQWRARQLQPAQAPRDAAAIRGAEIAEFRCGLCHQIRGTAAGSNVGPDLTHIQSRDTIAAGTLPNNPGTLTGWIENAQEIKPGNQMPDQGLSAEQVADVVAYLETLQ
jgi:cytochrome c oxidase subunit II